MSRWRGGGSALMGLALATAVLAATPSAAGLAVTGSSALASIPGSPMPMSVIYLTVRNAGTQADRLVGASTPAAQQVELHRGELRAGVATMRSAGGFDVPAGGELRLASGGDHLMLMGLTQPLRAGTTLPLVLHFQTAGDVKVVVPVVAASGK